MGLSVPSQVAGSAVFFSALSTDVVMLFELPICFLWRWLFGWKGLCQVHRYVIVGIFRVFRGAYDDVGRVLWHSQLDFS